MANIYDMDDFGVDPEIIDAENNHGQSVDNSYGNDGVEEHEIRKRERIALANEY